MNPIEYKLPLDVTKGRSQGQLIVKEGDVRTREIIASLYNGRKAIELTDGITAVMRAIKPDETLIYDDCEINGNTIRHLMPEQMLVVPGTVRCEITIYGAGGELLYSPFFEVVVEKNLYGDEEIESTSEFSALTKAMSDVQALEDEVAAAESGREGAELGRVSAEGQRQVSEEERTASEEARRAAEAGRIAEEAIRAENEVQRVAAEETRVGLYTQVKDDYDSGAFNGKDGNSFTVLGLYATLAALQVAHPTGAAGESYAVGTAESNTVYAWDVDALAWANLGKLQGPEGPKGDPGATGIGIATGGTTGQLLIKTASGNYATGWSSDAPNALKLGGQLPAYYAKASNYSTTEQWTGKNWIDGKKIYQKTVNCGLMPNATSKDTNHNVSNLDKVVGMEGIAIDNTDGSGVPFPIVSSAGILYTARYYSTRTFIRIATGNATWVNLTGYITIFYTCTDR